MSIDVDLICAGLSLLNLIPFVGHLIIERLEMSKDEDEKPGFDMRDPATINNFFLYLTTPVDRRYDNRNQWLAEVEKILGKGEVQARMAECATALG